MSYSDKITSNGSLSVLAKLDMRSCHDDGFQYFVKESDFNNLKSYFETLISSEEFGTKIDNIKFPYSSKMVDHFKIKCQNIESTSHEMDYNEKIKCKVLGCKCKKLIRLVQMRLHVGWHIMHGLTADPHRCGYCGLIGCNVSLVKTSGFGEKANYGPESDCEYHYKFNFAKKSSTEEAKKIPVSYPCLNRPVKCEHCEHIYWSYNMEAHHSKAHRGIDFEQLVTEEEVRLVKAWKFH
jgi:hypothetical protein